MSNQSVKEICARLKANQEAFSAVTSGQNYMPLLPLLEHPLHEVESQLRAKLIEVGIATSDVDCISIENLILFALSSWGSHWPTLAISWLEVGRPINEQLARRLETMSQEKNLSQAVRHRAFTLSKRWQRNQGSPDAK